ncbi:hypothetical protein BBO99_00005482 [Phytophthora kernoviae]|uniref:PDZ domain-containing protein n=2 Tax=Phytophthora kernoviae TaxID=325452 RepID=A0A3R7J6Q1_9STRA|nr:hypothetical protein G195_006447 [Phytophthora kernoviae 00238/432]KAG2523135.1 hypothetical protein JM16_005374 [Phytophthora kernoviae]KAG2524848.1 hypothetical protein JM18_004951 [Phytophthora kernoviae]RLN20082.1 hypothetical protein BBI17_005562 [Phytophthora kernoviae]RLN79142.1 hypothetical protein BBO99_00005482 [Phytophthora kernoviae]
MDVVKEYESAVKEKQAIEEEIEAVAAELTSGENPPGFHSPLVDAEGFPRADIDVYRVRHLRHTMACRQTDHKTVMKQIETLLPQVFAARSFKNAKDTDIVMESEPLVEKTAQETKEVSNQKTVTISPEEQLLQPFAVVESVQNESPAQVAGLQPQDQVVKFGSADVSNNREMAAIKDIVQHNIGSSIRVVVRRHQQQLLALELTPQSWRGPGVLGCLLQPLQLQSS